MPGVEARIADEIVRTGPISFARFVEAALYDPADGFYARPAAGWDGHCLTSPCVTPLFAQLLAVQIEEAWALLGRPSPFLVVDAGAGDGSLLRGLRDVLGDGAARGAIRLVGVERGPGGRRAILDAGFDALPDLAVVGSGAVGFLVANELLDNLPFHRLRGGPNGSVREIGVDIVEGRFVETELEPSPEAMSALHGPLAQGEERVVCPSIRLVIAQIARVLGRGYATLFDYAAGGPSLGVRCYRSHRTGGDPLDGPGLQDITVDVDFAAAAAHAREQGLTVWGPLSQRRALLGLGYQRALRSLREQQWSLEREGQWRGALRVFSLRQSASLLIDRSGLGTHQVLVLASADVPAPSLVRDSDPSRKRGREQGA